MLPFLADWLDGARQWYVASGAAFLGGLFLTVGGLCFTLYILLSLSGYRDAFSDKSELQRAIAETDPDALFSDLDRRTTQIGRAWALALGAGFAHRFFDTLMNDAAEVLPMAGAVITFLATLYLIPALIGARRDLVRWRDYWRRLKTKEGQRLLEQRDIDASENIRRLLGNGR